jgi:hypothetical protein
MPPTSLPPRLAAALAAGLAAVFAVVAAGCELGARETLAFEDDGAGGKSPGGTTVECLRDADCVAAGPRCCDCPTHAVPAISPEQEACSDVDCAPVACGSPMQAACSDYQCVLVCTPLACAGDIACLDGFVADGNGCLTCQCASIATAAECTVDSDCVRVRDDCCGCENGGYDDAVPAATAESHDRALVCPAHPSCPGGNRCAPDLAPRCVQGSCSLVAGDLPPGACGRSDLPACPAGQACYVNASDQATMHGVGVCQP